MYSQWDDLYKPQGELISSIIAPDHFSEYMKVKSQKQKNKDTKGPDVVKTKDGEIASASAHFDPEKGLLDSKGNILMTKESFMQQTDLDGFMVSY